MNSQYTLHTVAISQTKSQQSLLSWFQRASNYLLLVFGCFHDSLAWQGDGKKYKETFHKDKQ